MNSATSPLPLVIAGPILRRAEPTKLALWLALREDCDIKLDFAANGETLATFAPDSPSLHKRCLETGGNLKIVLLHLSFDRPLPQDCPIDYSLCLRACEDPDSHWQNVTDLCPDLLYDGQTSLHLRLPSQVGSVLHGSCRKPHHDCADGLVEADRLLARLHEGQSDKQDELPAWPSLLIMTGDQIYADDVAGPMLHAIHQAINLLDLPTEKFDGLEIPHFEDSGSLYRHEHCYYGRTQLLPQVDENRALLDILFGGVRKPVFTTDTATNHLISLHENLLMYLMVWSPALWEHVNFDLPADLSEEDKATYREEREIIQRFAEGLPRVRRLMAHLPIAMIFDDHDVTDDWNLNRQWEEAVYNHPFSTRMIGNSLTAYFLCQGWGNNPDGFTDNFMAGLQEALKAPGHSAHTDFIEEVLSFEGWEYNWPTEPPLIVIDTRTRRWRSESSMIKPSGLLDWEALGDLQQKLYGNDSVLLVSPAPIYGVKLIENIQRIFTWLGKPLLVDAENWMGHPGTASSILNVFMHSKTPQTFVILSGDVHYSFVYDVELRGRKGGPDIWQVTSSGFKNEFPRKLLDILDITNRWLYSPRSPLNWFTKRKRMRIVPRKPDGHADGRRLLNASGVGLVELDESGRPCRFRQLLADGQEIAFHRMEKHTRWQ